MSFIVILFVLSFSSVFSVFLFNENSRTPPNPEGREGESSAYYYHYYYHYCIIVISVYSCVLSFICLCCSFYAPWRGESSARVLHSAKGGCSGNRVWWFTLYYIQFYYIIPPPSTAPPSDCTPLCRVSKGA